MAKRVRKPPAQAAANLLAAQKEVAGQASLVAGLAQDVCAAADAEQPFTPAFAGAAAALFGAADELTTAVRRRVVLELTGVYPHSAIAEIVGMSVWWVSKVARDHEARCADQVEP